MINPLRFATVALLILMALPSLAQEQLTTSRLRSLGVNTRNIQPIVFSHDDRLIACFDRADFDEKKEGIFYRLWFFEVRRDGTFGEAHSVPLGLKNLQQGEFTPDDSYFVVLGNRGTTFQKINLRTFEVEELFTPEWGKPGFRGDPPVLFSGSGKLFAAGYPYDKSRFIAPRTIATIRPNATPDNWFEAGPDITTLEQNVERLWVTNYLSDSLAFFGQKYPQLTILSLWDGDSVTEFDRAWKFSGFWANAGRLVYSAKRNEYGESELTLYDSSKDSKTLLASDAKDYRYIFLSRNGRTVLTSQLSDTAERLVTWYAREADKWELKPLVTGSQGEPRTLASGWMRLSSAGDKMVHVSANGLTLYRLP